MTLERGRELESKADGLRSDGEFDEAGEYYSMAAFECLGDAVPSPYGKTASFGAELLLESVLCHAIAGSDARQANRASIGVLLAEDVLDREPDEEPETAYDRSRRGAWYEFTGDFELVGELGNHEEWYDSAAETYRRHGDPAVSLAEQEHLNLFTFYRVVTRGAGDGEPARDPTATGTLSEWVETKRSTLPSLLETLRGGTADWSDE